MTDKRLVFISHSSHDKKTADSLREILEKCNIPCWIAPRNIKPGERYPGAIIRGIEASTHLILILSNNSNTSEHVNKEVERAGSRKIPIIAIRLADIKPNDDLQFFIGISQWFDVFGADFTKKAEELARFIQESQITEHEPVASARIQMSVLAPNLVYPVALAVSNLEEQELKPEDEHIECGSGVDDAVFRVAQAMIKFSTLCLAGAYRSLGDDARDTRVDRLLSGIAQTNSLQWVRILKGLAEKLSHEEKTSGFIREHSKFLLDPCPVGPGADAAWNTLAEVWGRTPRFKTSDRSAILFLDLIQEYSKMYWNQQKRITDAGEKIKQGLGDILSKCAGFYGLELTVVLSVKPNKTRKVFEHQTRIFKGRKPDNSAFTYETDWDNMIESGHVFLRDPQKAMEHIELHPFILASDDREDILMWDRTDTYCRATYEKTGDKTCKDVDLLGVSDEFMGRIKAAYTDASEGNGAILSNDDMQNFINSTESFIEDNVKNPLCILDLKSRINSMREHFEAAAQKEQSLALKPWIEKANQIRIEASTGSFRLLCPTEQNDILTDENHGKYIIADKFFDNHGDMEKELNSAAGIIAKDTTKEVKILIYMAVAEVFHNKNLPSILGVEHLMIACSKICNKLVMDWYDAIGVAPKFLRDLTRYAVETGYKEQKDMAFPRGLVIKKRVHQVFAMAIEEANLAKRESVTVVDILSAILREGYSLPVRLLVTVFDLTRDRLLGEFYNVLRKR
jgi:hypothetical protein